MSEDQKKQLQTQLWNIANELRGKMNPDEFRDYILGFIFYKYLSEKIDIFANKLLVQDKIKYQEIKEDSELGRKQLEAIRLATLDELGYFLKPSELFNQLAVRGNQDGNVKQFILEDLGNVLASIEKSTLGTDSEDDFGGLFDDLDLSSRRLGKTVDARNTLIAKVLAHLNKIDFQLENSMIDILGDAYEYLIGQFAAGAGKKAGEFYTPQEVSTILAKIVTTDKTKLKNVYDPTCGSGSLLLRVARQVEDVGEFYGQESINTTYNLARMNMILHGVHYSKFDIQHEDTLEKPQHLDERFEAIVANPPFSAEWSANHTHMQDDRFSVYGRLAPKSRADYAFIQHMIYQLADNGTLAVVMSNGVLFRGAAEEHIRQFLIENKNYLDAVIALPINIFYGTGIPACILVFSKCRTNDDNVLFIDARECYQKLGNKNKLREEDIDKIYDSYTNRRNQDKFSYVASLDEIKANEYNLNVSRYVDVYEEVPAEDVGALVSKLNGVREEIKAISKSIESQSQQLDLPFPTGHNIEYLKRYKNSAMSQLFNREVRFKDEHDHDFPDWTESVLGDYYKNLSTGMTPSRSRPDYFYGDILWITSGELNYNIVYDTTEKITAEAAKNTGLVLYPRGTFFMAITGLEAPGTRGRCAISGADATTNQSCMAFTATPEVDTVFLYYWYRMYGLKFYFKFAQGTKQQSFNNRIVKEFEFIKPCIAEQRKISMFLASIDQLIGLLESKTIDNDVNIIDLVTS